MTGGGGDIASSVRAWSNELSDDFSPRLDIR